MPVSNIAVVVLIVNFCFWSDIWKLIFLSSLIAVFIKCSSRQLFYKLLPYLYCIFYPRRLPSMTFTYFLLSFKNLYILCFWQIYYQYSSKTSTTFINNSVFNCIPHIGLLFILYSHWCKYTSHRLYCSLSLSLSLRPFHSLLFLRSKSVCLSIRLLGITINFNLPLDNYLLTLTYFLVLLLFLWHDVSIYVSVSISVSVSRVM